MPAQMPRSFRTRLVIAFVAMFAAMSVAVSFAGLLLRESQIRGLFDKELLTRAADLKATMERQRVIDGQSVKHIVDDLADRIYFHDIYIQAWNEDGRPVAASNNLHGLTLPDGASINERPAADMIFTGRAPAGLLATTDSPILRGLRSQFAGQDGHSYSVVMMTSPMFITGAVNSLRWLFLGGNIAGVLAAGGAAWLVTGAMSRRLKSIEDQVRNVGPENLDCRIETRENDEISALTGHLNAMLERLKAGFETQERFIHDASHELKTPIATVQAEAQAILLGESTHDELLQFVNGTNDEMRRLGRLTESLLLLTRNNESHVVRRFQPVELIEIATNALRHLAVLANDYQVTLNLDFDPNQESPVVHCDADLLEAMISNLARNAIRFSPRDHEIRISVSQDATHAIVSVEDEGPGIPEDVLPHIFDRFFQNSQNKVRRGAGVGLAIASTVATLHGGTISASNRPGRGARLAVKLPISASISSGNSQINAL